jgi:probable addiction module antidote protein
MEDKMKKMTKDIIVVPSRKYLPQVQTALKNSKRAEKLMPSLRPLAAEYGMSRLSRASGVDRAHLYTLLSSEGDPRLTTLSAILDTLGFKLDISLKKK